VNGFVNSTNMATLPGKFTIGDPTQDSDAVLLGMVQDDWTGGGQVYDAQRISEGVDSMMRTAETIYPRLLSSPLETFSDTIEFERR